MSDSAPLEILLVEDSDTDALLTKEALCEAKMANNVTWVRDGVEAIEFLQKEGEFEAAPDPDLVLLDLNLPRMDGREFLQYLRRERPDIRVPVVVLTTSAADEDVLQVYDLKASCYITKPVDFEQFTKVVRSIDDFWFQIVRLPPKGDDYLL